jgi:hypothetical protein
MERVIRPAGVCPDCLHHEHRSSCVEDGRVEASMVCHWSDGKVEDAAMVVVGARCKDVGRKAILCAACMAMCGR